jgi:hypothetical protein
MGVSGLIDALAVHPLYPTERNLKTPTAGQDGQGTEQRSSRAKAVAIFTEQSPDIPECLSTEILDCFLLFLPPELLV